MAQPISSRSPFNLASFDAVIVGGGPAGMIAALTLGRSRLRTAVINAEAPRNSVTTASHGFLTRDGAHPNELLAVCKDQLAKYPSVSYVTDTVTATTRTGAGFGISLASGQRLEAERLIIATGHVDDLELLKLPGVKTVYGKTVYPCVFCDGYEHQDERLALFGSEAAAMYAPMVRLWTDDLVIFTNGVELPADDLQTLGTNEVRVHTAPIRTLESNGGRLLAVILETGERIERDAGFISDEYSRPATRFAEQLGVATTTNSWGAPALDVDEIGASSIDGLYVIGDAHLGFSGLIAAAAEGAACAAAIAHDVASDRWS